MYRLHFVIQHIRTRSTGAGPGAPAAGARHVAADPGRSRETLDLLPRTALARLGARAAAARRVAC